ncbi:MAG: chorismate mutase [Treponema sp.]|nr:chorismate mutase [Treponema sp.]
MKRLYSIRGAVCTENTEASIVENTGRMCTQIFVNNCIKSEDIVNVQFTMTGDLDAFNAAAAFRKSVTCIDVSAVPLFTSQEAEIKGMLPGVIRVMVTAYMEKGSVPVPVYLNGAECLRPDIAQKK